MKCREQNYDEQETSEPYGPCPFSRSEEKPLVAGAGKDCAPASVFLPTTCVMCRNTRRADCSNITGVNPGPAKRTDQRILSVRSQSDLRRNEAPPASKCIFEMSMPASDSNRDQAGQPNDGRPNRLRPLLTDPEGSFDTRSKPESIQLRAVPCTGCPAKRRSHSLPCNSEHCTGL